MTLTIETVRFVACFEAQFIAYVPETRYVSPLKSDLERFVNKSKNPLCSQHDSTLQLFTAHRDGRPIGRITAHVHGGSNTLHKWNRGYFGYFDCADDAEAAAALLKAAEDWCRARGHDEIMGNFNLTAMQQIGIVTDGFEVSPYTDLVWNPPHIPRLLTENGYSAEFPMTTFEVDLPTTETPAIGPKQQAILDDPDFAFLKISRFNIRDRMEDARQLLNAAFAQNPMFVPVTEEEFHFQAKDMAWIIDPRISAMLGHKGRPIATILVVPDLNPFLFRIRSRMGLTAPIHFLRHKFTCRRAVLIFSAVAPDWQGKGVNGVVLRRVILALKQAGYKTLGNTWIADVNAPSLRQKEKSGAHKLHRIHLFRKALS